MQVIGIVGQLSNGNVLALVATGAGFAIVEMEVVVVEISVG